MVDKLMKKVGCAPNTPTLDFETDVLEKTIRKIAGLLQVGFGEAGAQIIAQNIKVQPAHGWMSQSFLSRRCGLSGVVFISPLFGFTLCDSGIQARQAEPVG